MNHFNYGIIIGAIESAPLLGAYNSQEAFYDGIIVIVESMKEITEVCKHYEYCMLLRLQKIMKRFILSLKKFLVKLA